MAISQGRQNQSLRQTTYRNSQYVNSQYVYGNAVRQPARRQEMEPARHITKEQEPQVRTKKVARRKNQFSIPFFMFLISAMVFCGVVLVNYVSIRSEITTSIEKIAALESTLNDMRLENDEDYSRIKNGIDLDEIKMKAIGKLGMTYAKEGQVIKYTEVDDDYVRQVSDIPKK